MYYVGELINFLFSTKYCEKEFIPESVNVGGDTRQTIDSVHNSLRLNHFSTALEHQGNCNHHTQNQDVAMDVWCYKDVRTRNDRIKGTMKVGQIYKKVQERRLSRTYQSCTLYYTSVPYINQAKKCVTSVRDFAKLNNSKNPR